MKKNFSVILAVMALMYAASAAAFGAPIVPTCNSVQCEAQSNSCGPRYCVPFYLAPGVQMGSICGGSPLPDNTLCSDDGNECTVGSCFQGECLLEMPVSDGTPCTGGTCQQAQCVPDQPPADIPEFGVIAAVGIMAVAGIFAYGKRK